MWGLVKCFPIILWHENWHPHGALHPKYGHQIFYDAGNTLFEKSLAKRAPAKSKNVVRVHGGCFHVTQAQGDAVRWLLTASRIFLVDQLGKRQESSIQWRNSAN